MTTTNTAQPAVTAEHSPRCRCLSCMTKNLPASGRGAPTSSLSIYELNRLHRVFCAGVSAGNDQDRRIAAWVQEQVTASQRAPVVGAVPDEVRASALADPDVIRNLVDIYGAACSCMDYGAKFRARQSLDEALAALAQSQPAVLPLDEQGGAAGWRDISTAPKDGTPVLIAQEGKHGWYIDAAENHYEVDEGPSPVDLWMARESSVTVCLAPTHWMPLPAAPAHSQEPARSGEEGTANA